MKLKKIQEKKDKRNQKKNREKLDFTETDEQILERYLRIMPDVDKEKQLKNIQY
jgi:hypothetical protein